MGLRTTASARVVIASTACGTKKQEPEPACPPTVAGASTASLATGTVTGPNISAAVCSGGLVATVGPAVAGSADPYLFFLSGAGGSGDFVFQNPATAIAGQPLATLDLSAAAPGESSTAAGQSCGGVYFSYQVPLSPGIDCDGGTDTTCPAGCNRSCPALGCGEIPCEPNTTSTTYSATGPSRCTTTAATQPTTGSWDLSLTSLDPVDGGTGDSYVAHGTLTATLVGPGGATDTATLSLTF